MKKFYEVEIKLYVLAEDEWEAAVIATRECQPEAAEVDEAGSVDSRWWKAIPYGSDDDKTCGEIMGELVATEKGKK